MQYVASMSEKKKRVRLRDVRGEAWELIVAQKGPLRIGLALMVV